MVLGTPPYMSPEQFTGRPIDVRSDIYSLAVMAYEMLTGKLPFKADTAWEWATQHMTQNPIPIESLAEGMRAPETMRAAIRKALAKNPEDRFQTVSEFEAAFAGGAIASTGTGTAAVPAVSGGRQKTEMGAPIDVAAAFGPAGSGGMVGSGPGPMAPAYTPAAGNMAMPTPAGIPQPPVRGGGGGEKSNKGLILGIAGVVGVASVIAIVFAMKGSSSAPAAPLPSGAFTNSDPMTVLSSPAPTDSTPPATSGSGGGDVPPLNGGSSGGHGGGGSSGGHGGSSGGSSGGGKPEPPQCAKARGEKPGTPQYQSDKLACIAGGGHV
jgi:serine/threonine-protein kinase